MSFISAEFVLFVAAAVAVFYALPGRLRVLWLLAASLAAYGALQPVFLLHLVAFTAAAWGCGFWIARAADRSVAKRRLAVALVMIVGNLAVFKYTAFANESLRKVFGVLGAEYPIPAVTLLLPIGISFYTFQLVGYLVDVYRGAKPERHFGHFLLFVSFFPKILSGPIERAKDLLPQFRRTPTFDASVVASGLELIAWGAFKKLVVADRLAPFVAQVYSDPTAHTGAVTVFATWLFAFQVYCDFSGYTDMALGVARLFGFRLTANFNRPYFATSIQDFWKRWHISLSSWLTDYVYTPLTRNRVIRIKWYYLMLASLFVTFVISGLWHGAQWTFVAWGALHGTYLVSSALTRTWRARFITATGLNKWPRVLHAGRVSTTFVLVCFAYILFNAQGLGEAAYMIGNLGTGWLTISADLVALIDNRAVSLLVAMTGATVVMITEAAHLTPTALDAPVRARGPVRWAFQYAVVASTVLLGAFYEAPQQFLYFRF